MNLTLMREQYVHNILFKNLRFIDHDEYIHLSTRINGDMYHTIFMIVMTLIQYGILV